MFKNPLVGATWNQQNELRHNLVQKQDHVLVLLVILW